MSLIRSGQRRVLDDVVQSGHAAFQLLVDAGLTPVMRPAYGLTLQLLSGSRSISRRSGRTANWPSGSRNRCSWIIAASRR